MIERDAAILHKITGYGLLMISMTIFLPGAVLAEGLGRNPFSDTRDGKDQTEYPSVLTMPDFEQNISTTAMITPPVSTVSTGMKSTMILKTPVQPAITSAEEMNKTPSGSANTYISRVMILRENVLLSQGVDQWAKQSGYKMLWNSQKDYIIFSTITFSGKTSDEILEQLGKLFASENYGLVIKFYQKNNVLLVDEQ